MTTFGKNLKMALLTAGIGLGLLAHWTPAHAAEEKALVAGGCFWCVEADFERVPGVLEVVSGFAGGSVANPSYKDVTRGGTGHLEVVEITFDNDVIGYDEIVHMFLRSIDPLDAGGQFCDRGESYSTAIFALDDAQARLASDALTAASQELGKPVVTPLREAAPFYPADEYHQDFYKSSDIIFTRFGPQTKASAYKKYRASCNRDARVEAIWGDDAPFIGS